MKKLGIAILILAVVILAALLIVPRFINVNKYHDQIQAQLENKLGRKVTLGQMGLRLLPPSFQVSDAVIGEDSSFNTGRPFAEAQKLSISIKFWPLLRKEVQVKSLELEQPHIELVRNVAGTWNFSSLGQPSTAPSPQQSPVPGGGPQKPPPAPQPAQPAGQQLSLANLVIRDGQVAITDEQKHQPRAVYDHIDLSVSDFAADKEFSIRAAAHLPGQGKQTISLKGKGGPIQRDNMMNTHFDGALTLDQVSISALQKFLNSQALQGMEALVSGDARLKNDAGKLASSGKIKLENPQAHNLNIGYPIAVDYDIVNDMSRDLLKINKGDLKLGTTPITIAGTLDGKPTPAQIDMKITASNASLSEAARLASAFGVAFGQGMDVKGQLNANIQARGDATTPAMNGQLSLRNVSVSGKGLPQPVNVPDMELALTPDEIRSNDFSATTGSTSVNVNFALSHYTTPNSIISAGLRATNARVGELLNMARAYGVTAVQGISGDGVLNLDVHAQGPAKNMNALNFSGTGKLQNASLKLPSLTKAVQIHNSDLRFSQNSIVLENLAASVGQTNATGSLTLKNFAAPQVQFNLNADKVNVNELQQLYVNAPAPARTARGDGFWNLVPRAEAEPAPPAAPPGMLSNMTGTGTIAVGTVQYNDLVMSNVHSNVRLDRGMIYLNPVKADLYGGQTTGSITVDTRPAQTVYTVNLKTVKVDANKLISSVSSLKQVLYGLLSSNVNATFSSTTADAIARGLNGNLGLNLTNGKLMNVDLLHQLSSLGKFLGGVPAAPQGFTNVTQLSGNFDVHNGIAQTNNLKAAIDGGTLAATGLVNLADQSLNMHVTAVLNKSLTTQVGGTSIGGFMNTALANNQGELVMPVIVTGTFQHPQFAPDVEQLARMKLQNLLPTSKNPGALTSGILESILGGKGENGTDQKKKGLGGILGALTGKQQQDQSQQQQKQQGTQGVSGNQGQQQQPPPKQNPLGDVLGQVFGKKKKQQQPAQQPPQQQQQQQPPK